MRILLQRVSEAKVVVEGTSVAEVGRGLLLMVGVGQEDDLSKLKPMAQKIANMRVFPDERGRFHFSLLDENAGVLLVPQFTLFADTSKGRRPEFFGAMKPPEASELFDAFAHEFELLGVSPVEKGVFGADMKVSLCNDGPVTIWLEN